VLFSVFLEAAGLLISYSQTGSSVASLDAVWRASPGNFFSFATATLTGVISGSGPVSIVGLGILVLMLTPYLRILAAIVYYAIVKDYRYLGITLVVFAVINAGLAFF